MGEWLVSMGWPPGALPWAYFILGVVLKISVVLGVLLLMAAWMIWVERKVLGRIQVRRGPKHVGKLGLLQPLADGIKMIMKEDITPLKAIKPIYIIAPGIVAFTAIMSFAVIPFGDWALNISELHPGLDPFPLGYITNLDLGILFLLAMSSLAVYGVAWGGWASGGKYGLIGGLRASAQMISYELTLGLAFLGVVMITGTLNLVEVVRFQAENGWNLLYQPVAMVLFVVSMFAETNRLPFDLPEGETELVAGYHTEYSSMRFGLFFVGEYLHMIAVSSICTILFLGGWLPPFHNLFIWGFLGDIPVLGTLLPLFFFLVKVGFFLFLFVWVRGTFPRLRYDQLMKFGWKVLLEIGFLNLMLAAYMRAHWPTPNGYWWAVQAPFFVLFLMGAFGYWPFKQTPEKTVHLED